MSRNKMSSQDDRFGTGAKLYCLWAVTAIGVSLVLAGPTVETITRLLVLAFIAGQYVFRATLVKALPGLAPPVRFITMGVLLAAVVEGFHMISKPVYSSLLVGPDTSPADALRFYAIDLLVTTPAYVVIFAVIWFLINRFHYGLWTYIVVTSTRTETVMLRTSRRSRTSVGRGTSRTSSSPMHARGKIIPRFA